MKIVKRETIIDERLMSVFSLPKFKDLLRQNRNWLILAAAIFTAGSFSSFLGISFQPGSFSGIEGPFSGMEQLLKLIMKLPPLITALLVFINNLVTMIQMLLLGALAGVSPLVTLFLNGYLLGAVAAAYKADGGSILVMIVSGILPHGILELFALFICGAFGLKLGYHCIAVPLPGKTRRQSFGYIWKEVFLIAPLTVALLLGAALIEIFVTARLVGYLG